MVISVEIYTESARGTVEYDDALNDATVVFPDAGVATAVDRYLSSPREFIIPESKEIDDYRVDKALPVDNITYFELAMCSLWSNTGVLVDWDTEKRTE